MKHNNVPLPERGSVREITEYWNERMNKERQEMIRRKGFAGLKDIAVKGPPQEAVDQIIHAYMRERAQKVETLLAYVKCIAVVATVVFVVLFATFAFPRLGSLLQFSLFTFLMTCLLIIVMISYLRTSIIRELKGLQALPDIWGIKVQAILDDYSK